MDNEDVTPGPSSASNRPMRKSAAQSMKKMKIDEDQQVNDLFARDQARDAFTFDLSTKKFVFKLINETKTDINKSKIPINSVWQRYFNLDDDQQKNPGTGKPHFQNKEQMVRAIEAMEADDLVMKTGEDVFLIGDS